jgi:hypothetical protein
MEGRMYRSTSSPRQQLEVSGQLHALAALPPWETAPRYPLDSKLGGPHRRSGRYGEVKILDPTGTRTPSHSSIVQPVGSRYTDYATANQQCFEIYVLTFWRLNVF